LFLAAEAVLNRHWFIPPPRQDVRIEVAGTPGAGVEADFQADGVASTRTAVLPATFQFRARRLSFTISQEQGVSELSATVFINERSRGTTSHPAPGYVSGYVDGV